MSIVHTKFIENVSYMTFTVCGLMERMPGVSVLVLHFAIGRRTSISPKLYIKTELRDVFFSVRSFFAKG